MGEFNEQRKAEREGKVQFIGGDSFAPPPPPPLPPGQVAFEKTAVPKKVFEGTPPPITFSSNPREARKSPQRRTSKNKK